MLKMLRSVLKSLNGDATPASCAAAVLFGCLIGLVPFGVHTLLFFALLVVFRVPAGLGMVCGAILTLLRLVALQFVGAPLGASLLAEGSVSRGVVVALLDIPVIGLIPLEQHAVLGGIVMAIALGVLLWLPTVMAVRGYRSKLRGKLTGSKKYDKVAWLFGRPPEEDKEWGRFAIIRWKLVLGVVAVFVLLGWLGAGPAIDRGVSTILEEALMEDAEIGKVSCSIFSGEVVIEDLKVGGQGESGKETLSARRAHANISIVDLLRRKAVIENLELDRPRLRLETDEDGKLVILKKHEEKDKEAGLDPGEIYERAKDTYGKIENARDWVQKFRDLMSYIQARDDVAAEDPVAYARLFGYTKLPELGPRVVVKSIKVSGLDLELSGDGGLSLRDFGVHGQEFSSDPARHTEKMSAKTDGKLGDQDPATFLLKSLASGLDGTLHVDLEKMAVANLGVDLLQPLVADTLPFLLKKGTVALDIGGAQDWIKGDGTCDLTARLILKDLNIAPRQGVSTLAGIDATQLCAAVSDAGTFGLDVRITGHLSDPEIDVGNTMDNLMRLGAAAFKKQALKELEARHPGIGKILGGDGPLGLPDAGGVVDAVGGLLGGKNKKDGDDPAKKALKGIGNLLGGKKDKKKK